MINGDLDGNRLLIESKMLLLNGKIIDCESLLVFPFFKNLSPEIFGADGRRHLAGRIRVADSDVARPMGLIRPG